MDRHPLTKHFEISTNEGHKKTTCCEDKSPDFWNVEINYTNGNILTNMVNYSKFTAEIRKITRFRIAIHTVHNIQIHALNCTKLHFKTKH